MNTYCLVVGAEWGIEINDVCCWTGQAEVASVEEGRLVGGA